MDHGPAHVRELRLVVELSGTGGIDRLEPSRARPSALIKSGAMRALMSPSLILATSSGAAFGAGVLAIAVGALRAGAAVAAGAAATGSVCCWAAASAAASAAAFCARARRVWWLRGMAVR